MRLVQTANIQPTELDVRECLERLTASNVFRASPRLIAFLRYVVERTLAGEGAQLKGYTIAVHALGRPASFDPQTDPIVRVEAGRLRRALARFYDGEGADEPVVIDLANGNYAPHFRVRDAAPANPWSDDAPPLGGPLVEIPIAALWRMIEQRREQIRTMAQEVDALAETFRRSLKSRAAGPEASACPPMTRLLPTAPTSSDRAGTADGRENQQAQGAPAARPR